jgi:hypothetical protein
VNAVTLKLTIVSTTRLNAKIASSTAVHASIINIVLADKALVFC